MVVWVWEQGIFLLYLISKLFWLEAAVHTERDRLA